MARQQTLFDLAHASGQDDLSLIHPDDIARRLRALAAGEADPNPFGLCLSVQDARVVVDTTPSPRGTAQLAALLHTFLLHRPSGPVTAEAVTAWKPYQAWQEWVASLRPSWNRPSRAGTECHDAHHHTAIVLNAVAGLGGWHENAYRTLLLQPKPWEDKPTLEERLAAWERYDALLGQATPKAFEDLRPGDRILEWRGLEAPGILTCSSTPHNERNLADAYWRHIHTVEEVTSHGPMPYSGMFAGFSEAERAALFEAWPFVGGGVRAFGHEGGVLCLAAKALALPSTDVVYGITKRLISPQKTAYAAIGALHGLENVFGPHLCDQNPFAVAMKRAFEDTLAEEGPERLQEQASKRAPRPELLRCLAPLARALVPITDIRAVHEELKRWVLPETSEYGYTHYRSFTSPSYMAPVLWGALAAAVTEADVLDVLARNPGGGSIGVAPSDPSIHVLETVPPPPPRTRKAARAPVKATYGDAHRAGRGRGRYRPSRPIAA